MTEDTNLLLRLADLAISLAVLVAIVAGFVRGEILSRRSISEIIALTVEEVLKRLK